MLTVDLPRWVKKLHEPDWESIPHNVSDVISKLKTLVPANLHEKIDRAVVKARRGEGDAQEVFIILDGNRDTGEQLVFEIMSGPMDSPDHIHGETPDADYGEVVWTLAGAIEDVLDGGRKITHHRGDVPIKHGPKTRHQPHVKRWWIGVFYHPCASRLAA